MTTVDQQELARHLGVSDRRVRQLEAEHIVSRLDGEPVTYDLDASVRRYRLYVAHDIDTVCRELERAAESVDGMLMRMRAENDVQERRRIAEEDGGSIGKLQAALDLANTLMPEHARDMARTVEKLIVGGAIGEFLALCNWRLAEDARANTGAVGCRFHR